MSPSVLSRMPSSTICWQPRPAAPSHVSSAIPTAHRGLLCRKSKHLTPRATSPSLVDPGAPPPPTNAPNRSHETDYVVIGSGIGGLCCAALLAKYGYGVTVVESHYHPGGAAHAFDVQACQLAHVLRTVQLPICPQGFQFDAGPSFFAGLRARPDGGLSSNPLKQVLDAMGETIECATYDRVCCCVCVQLGHTARKNCHM